MNDQDLLKPVGELPAEFLNKNEVAALLGVSRRTVDNMVARRELPFLRLSRKILRFPRQAVLEGLNRRIIGRV
jgi:excisionase family DNA binding protein